MLDYLGFVTFEFLMLKRKSDGKCSLFLYECISVFFLNKHSIRTDLAYLFILKK